RSWEKEEWSQWSAGMQASYGLPSRRDGSPRASALWRRLEIRLGAPGDLTSLRCGRTGVGLRLAEHADRLRRDFAPNLVCLLLLKRPLRRFKKRNAVLARMRHGDVLHPLVRLA